MLNKWIAMSVVTAATCATAGPTYKCTSNGKTEYTDAPCMNAQEVDVTPTQGMNKWTGTEKKPTELMLKEMESTRRKALSKALQPIATVSEEDFEKAGKRSNLTPSEQNECKQLDNKLGQLKASQEKDETALYNARRRYFALKC